MVRNEKINHRLIRERGSIPFLNPDRVSKDLARELYRSMLRLRRIEEAIIGQYRVAEEIKCPVHFSIGQEGVSSALTHLLRPEDHLYSHHRSHGYYFAKKCPLNAMLAELFGRETGANGGLAGSQEISYPKLNFNSGAILTGASSIAVGSALAFKLNKTDQVAVAGFGEAATEEGAFWEAVSYASTKKLPLIYICENNIYSMLSHQLTRQPADDLHQRVSHFGMSSRPMYGNDVVAAYLALDEAIGAARSGQGPQFLEFYTYRWNAHVGPESDDQFGYRETEEQNFWKGLCPLANMERQLHKLGWISADDIAVMGKEIQDEINDAFSFARNSAFPQSFLEKNWSLTSPLAERLLPISEMERLFDAHQHEARLAPY